MLKGYALETIDFPRCPGGWRCYWPPNAYYLQWWHIEDFSDVAAQVCAQYRTLSRQQTERNGKAFWDAEEFDCHLARCWDSRVASEPLSPREAGVGTLRARKNHTSLTRWGCSNRTAVRYCWSVAFARPTP